MTMKMKGEYTLPVDQAVVWDALNDAEVLAACIPGCEEFEKAGDTRFRAVAQVKIGPVKARFRGEVTLSEIDAPNSYRISGQGEGGLAGFAKGGAVVRLAPTDGGGTLLTYEVDAQIGGKLAQIGQRLLSGAAKKTADEFFENFRAQIALRSAVPAASVA
ncbi:MAG: carbon monoxide dehydrogenase subunit G [Parvibaculaceae bacterium]